MHKKFYAYADADAKGIRPKHNMPPIPSVGGDTMIINGYFSI